MCFLILAVWTQVCLSCWQTVYFHSQLSLITSLDLFPLLVWFVCSYSARINKTFKSLPLNTLNVGVQLKWRQVWEYENGGRYIWEAPKWTGCPTGRCTDCTVSSKSRDPQNLYYLLGERWNFDQFFNFYLTAITICSSPLSSQFNDIQMKVKNCLRMEISLGLEKTWNI